VSSSIIVFTHAELNWLQSFLRDVWEMKWPGSFHPPDDPTARGGVLQMSTLEHEWLYNFLLQVRACITNPTNNVDFNEPRGMGPRQLAYMNKTLIDYQGGPGMYIFKGPYGQNIQEGAQFPDATGSANSNIRGQGSFPENSFYIGSNIFNDILKKLGSIVFPEATPPPIYHSPGEC